MRMKNSPPKSVKKHFFGVSESLALIVIAFTNSYNESGVVKGNPLTLKLAAFSLEDVPAMLVVHLIWEIVTKRQTSVLCELSIDFRVLVSEREVKSSWVRERKRLFKSYLE